MPLEYCELEPIINDVLEKVRADIIRANRLGTLDLVLNKYDADISLPVVEDWKRTGDTILVLGDLRVSKDDINKLFKMFKVSKDNFEFVEYDDVTNYSFSKLIENQRYTDIFVGPVPHKAMDIGSSSSLIEFLQTSENILAKVSVLRDNSGQLKISKKTFKNALEESALLNNE